MDLTSGVPRAGRQRIASRCWRDRPCGEPPVATSGSQAAHGIPTKGLRHVRFPLGTLSRSGSHAIAEHAVPPYVHDAALLLLRLALGLTMAGHGAQKLFGWFSGVGLGGAGRVFTSAGYPAGKAMAVMAGLSEVLGGVGLALGLLTPLAGAAVVGVMVNAVAVKWGGGFFAPTGWSTNSSSPCWPSCWPSSGPAATRWTATSRACGPTGPATASPRSSSAWCWA